MTTRARAGSLARASRCWPCRAPPARRRRTGRPSGRRSRCRRATSSSRPTRFARSRTACRSSSSAPRAALVSCGCWFARAPRPTRADKQGVARRLTAALLDQGTTTQKRRTDRRRRSTRSAAARHRRRHGPDLRQHPRDEGQLAARLRAALRRRPQPGVQAPTRSSGSGSRRSRASGSATKIRTTSPASCSIGWSTDSIRTACRTTARRSRSQSITARRPARVSRAYFVPNNAILAVVGDVTPRKRSQAPSACSAPGRARVGRRAGAPPDAHTPRDVVDKPDAVQTEIRVGQLALPRKHPDYLAMRPDDEDPWRGRRNRLHRVLRSERGLTYGASADFQRCRQAGDFVADTDTRTDTTGGSAARDRRGNHEAAAGARVTIASCRMRRPTSTGNFPLTIETPEAIAAQVLNALFYGLPLSDIENYRELVNAITPDDIQRVARKYSQARSVVRRPRRQRGGVREGPDRRRLSEVRADRAARPGSGVRDAPAASVAGALPRLESRVAAGFSPDSTDWGRPRLT